METSISSYKYVDKLKKKIENYKYTPDEKIIFFKELANEHKEESLELLWKLRDIIPYTKGYDLIDLISLLYKVSLLDLFGAHERIITATCLYNHGYVEYCYDCFKHLASSKNVELMYRVESAKFLFSSNNETHQRFAHSVIIELINDPQYESDKRYTIITHFHSKKGIKSFLNKTKLRIPYDEEFVYGIHQSFFYKKENGIRERLLSGQHLLQMSISTEEEKEKIEHYFLTEIAGDVSLDENTRADAADIVLRLSSKNEMKIKAREIIGKIGYEQKGETFIEKTETIYSNSQNVHDFTDQVNVIVEQLIEENISSLKVDYKKIHNTVAEYTREHISNREHRHKILKSLHRISIDTAVFTKYNAPLSEIFVLLWAKIEKYDEDVIKGLKIRLLEELVDMGETCSSGHISRFVNVLGGYDEKFHLRVTWKDQIIANIVGRFYALMRDCKNEELQYKLINAKSDLAEEGDELVYQKFIEENTPNLYNELYQEFVKEGYVKKEEFQAHFTEGIERLK